MLNNYTSYKETYNALLNKELQESYNYSKQAYQLDKSNKWYSQFYADVLFKIQNYYESAKIAEF